MAQTFYDKRTRDYCSSAHLSVTSLCKSSTSPGELEQLLTCTRAPWKEPGLWEPPWLLPACCSGDTAALTHTGHREKTQCLPPQTGNLGNTGSREKPQSAACDSHVKMYYFSTVFTLLIVLSACTQRNCEQLLSVL